MKKQVFLILAAVTGLVALVSCATPTGRLRYVELHTRTCSICNRMTPVLDAAAAKYNGIVDVSSYGDSSDTGEALNEEFGIKRYPANLFFDREGKLFFRYEGLLDQKSVEEILDKKIKADAITETSK